MSNDPSDMFAPFSWAQIQENARRLQAQEDDLPTLIFHSQEEAMSSSLKSGIDFYAFLHYSKIGKIIVDKSVAKGSVVIVDTARA